MASLNLVQIIGNLGADPEARSMSNGKEVVSLRLACSESWKDRDGNRQERTEWVSVVIFNEGVGRVAKEYLRKGSRCYISGKLQTRKWTDNAGQDRYSTEVVVQPFSGELILLDGPNGGAGRPTQQRDTGGGFSAPASSRRAAPAFDTDLDDDVPFIACDPALECRVR